MALIKRSNTIRDNLSRSVIIFLLSISFYGKVHAQGDNGQKSLAERSRATQMGRFEFMAMDLLDELVYQWKKSPPFASPATVALIELSVPLGFNAHLETLLENHFFDLAIKNPDTRLKIVHCPACTAITTYSTQERTIVARGADINFEKSLLNINADYGLYLDFEIEKNQLKLRSRLTTLNTERQLFQGKSLATDSGHPPLLRRAALLPSAEEARADYLSILEGRPKFDIPAGLRISVLSINNENVSALPMVWASAGVDLYTSASRNWISSTALSVAAMASSDTGWQIESGIKRHLFTYREDLSSPQFYLGGAFSYTEFVGDSARILQSNEKLTTDQIIAKSKEEKLTPKSSDIGVIITGEIRMDQYYRLGVFAQEFVSHLKNKNFARGMPHCYGIGFGLKL